MWTIKQVTLFLRCWCILLCTGQLAYGQVITADLEVKKVSSVGASWTTVNLTNTYTSAVVVCSYNLPSKTDPAATTRIRNITTTSFQVRIQQFESSNTVTASDVHCIIADEGAYNTGGLKFEARTVVSDQTSGLSVPNTWDLVNNEEVTTSVTQTYTAPVVLGQVMSFNDTKASVFWTYNCTSRTTPPFDGTGRICVGKHIGQINSTRANETIGYIVAETATATINDVKFKLARGADTVLGVGNNPPYTYAVADNYDVGVVSQNAEDGGQGGWAVLYGADPLPANTLNTAIEEETVAGDKTRTHTTEQVSYWVFKDNQTTSMTANKTVAMSSESASSYAIPGSDVIYTISAANTGTKPVDADSIEIIDSLPSKAVFYNGDLDGAGPATGSVLFTSVGSGLSFTPATDLAFSNSATKPSNFAGCSYTPSSGYDPNVTYICFNPKGSFNAGSITPSSFSLKFRSQVE